MNTRLLALIVLTLVAAVVALQLRPHTPSDDAHRGVDARNHSMTPRPWSGMTMPVPSDWVRVEGTATHVTWAAPDRSETVTLGASADPGGQLSAIVMRTAPEVAAAAVGGRVDGIIPLADGAIGLRVRGQSGDAEVRLVQVWRRLAGTGLIAIASWTSTTGSWPTRGQEALPRVRG